MDENDADNMALQVRCEALDNLAQRWNEFVQSCLEAAARDDTIFEDAEANVPGLLRETEFLHRETRMALNRVREQERNLMKIKGDNPERSLQLAASYKKNKGHKTLEAIDNVFKSQQESQVVLESKLETITSNMVMKDDLEKELKQLRDWIQVRPPSGDKSVLVKQEEELCGSDSDDSNDTLPPKKRRRVEEYTLQLGPPSKPVKLSDDEQRRLDKFTQTFAPLFTILQQIVPCESEEEWDHEAIMSGFQGICRANKEAAGNMTRFMSMHWTRTWYCALTVASGKFFQAVTYNRDGKSTCMRCEGDCLQIMPLETDGRPGRYRARIARPAPRIPALPEP